MFNMTCFDNVLVHNVVRHTLKQESIWDIRGFIWNKQTNRNYYKTITI